MAAFANAPPPRPGTLFVVATPIGNLEDITVRALRVLREVALIAAEDTRRTAHLLARHAIPTPTTSLHEHNERTKTAAILARLERGDHVALVSDAGTPTVSDPGAELIRQAIAQGVRVEPIPGPSAILTALVASGFPADTFTFMGFPPTRSKDRNVWFDRVAGTVGTVVFFEAPHRIQATLAKLQEVAGDCVVSVGRELTKAHEELVRGPISAVLGGGIREQGEFTVVVDIGQKTIAGVTESELVTEFGVMAKQNGANRRRTVSELAQRHGLPPNQVYDILERAKKSGH